jgi:hypothetical protein
MNIKTGKCPGCGKVPFNIRLESVDIGDGFTSKFHGVMYVCPNIQCKTILGVGIDPVALKTDTINGVVNALRGK